MSIDPPSNAPPDDDQAGFSFEHSREPSKISAAHSNFSVANSWSQTLSVRTSVHGGILTPSVHSVRSSRNVTVAQLMDLGAMPRNPSLFLGSPGEDTVLETPSVSVEALDDAAPPAAGGAQQAESGISLLGKLRPSLAAFATSQDIGVMSVQPYLYVTIFRGNSTLISFFGIITVLYDIWNGPFFGMMSDQGYFNFGCFRDGVRWGRRAPLTLLSIPVGFAAFLMNFSAGWLSELDWWGGVFDTGVAVACWFLVVNFLVATCFSMFYCASGSAISELFPTQEERLTVLMFRGPTDALGGVLGTAVVGSLATAQTRGGTGSSYLLLGLGVYTACLWLLVIPWALLMKRSVMTKAAKYPSLLFTILELFRDVPPFRLYVLGEHVMSAGITVFTSVIPFALRYVLDFGDDAPLGYTILVISIGFFGILTYPIAPLLLRHFDAAPLLGTVSIIGGVCVALACVVGYQLRENFSLSIAVMSIIAGLGCGAGISLWNMLKTILLTFIIDLDQVTRAKRASAGSESESQELDVLPARRDGLFVTANISFGIASKVWIYIVILLIDQTGYDSSLDDFGDEQPQAFITYIFVVVGGVCPLMIILYGICMLALPLKAERLAEIKDDYARLYVMAKAAKELNEVQSRERGEQGEDASGVAAERGTLPKEEMPEEPVAADPDIITSL